jgi:hypothetical protein
LGLPWSFDFHNQIIGPSLGLHFESVGDTLYYITSQPKESTKNRKRCMFMCPTKTSSSITLNPRFEIWFCFNQLGNEWLFLWNHQCFHQIR